MIRRCGSKSTLRGASPDPGSGGDMVDALDPVSALKRDLENLPKVSIEKAAEMLEVSVRTMYRRRLRFECVRRKGHWYITLRSIRHHIEEQHYSGTTLFDLTKKSRHFGQSGQD